ncbi:MAG: hypothetical protein ACI8T1_004484 [Verrucomicrobiales bacterium]|jgi:uncharacterized protein (TIGR02284 family)
MNTATSKACIDVCNSLLRGEISAVETYDQAAEKFANEPQVKTLLRIREDHQASVDRLTMNVLSMGGQPNTSSGAWGAFAKTVQGAANLLGDDSALGALTKGEEHGRSEHTEALDNEDVMPECKAMIRDELLPRVNQHLSTLNAL